MGILDEEIEEIGFKQINGKFINTNNSFRLERR